MSKESTIKVINKSMYTLMEFSRKSRGPITRYRMRDLYILGFIFFDSKDHRATMLELAAHMNITPAAASQIISGYEKNGWVIRTRSEKDRRTVYVEISDKIKEHLKSKWRDNQQFLSDFLDELSPEDLDSLERILNKVLDYFEEYYK